MDVAGTTVQYGTLDLRRRFRSVMKTICDDNEAWMHQHEDLLTGLRRSGATCLGCVSARNTHEPDGVASGTEVLCLAHESRVPRDYVCEGFEGALELLL